MKLNTIYSYFTIILFAPIIGKLLNKIIIYYKCYKDSKNSNLLYNLAHRLTPREFEIWCSEYLTHLGFTNIFLLPPSPDGGKDIICENESEKYYVECKRFSLNNSITPLIVEQLLGAMIADNIFNGLIITTGEISDETKDLLTKIKKPYSIKIISSSELSIKYSDYILKTN